jgi:hypothetical protein
MFQNGLDARSEGLITEMIYPCKTVYKATRGHLTTSTKYL